MKTIIAESQNHINELRKLQVNYLEMKVFLTEISNKLENSFDRELGTYNANKLLDLAETMSNQIDGYHFNSFELANTNSILNEVCEILKKAENKSYNLSV